ncbi:hypothetical protein [Streptomyces sp. TP-A0875]|uniref:hypothetical protein n=1 Tax=Streptomyces sp. TP-A0875 TaxID=552354 RepID=UPI000AFC0F50|nr:hypothetical protein [Streptomyces sp. TP-A0875]
MFQVTTPVEGFTGEVAGVRFADGRATTDDPAALAYFRRRGYGVKAMSARKAPAKPQKE